MRKKREKQLPIMSPSLAHPKARELEAISKILDQNPIIYQMSLQDLTKSVSNKGNGANPELFSDVLQEPSEFLPGFYSSYFS